MPNPLTQFVAALQQALRARERQRADLLKTLVEDKFQQMKNTHDTFRQLIGEFRKLWLEVQFKQINMKEFREKDIWAIRGKIDHSIELRNQNRTERRILYEYAKLYSESEFPFFVGIIKSFSPEDEDKIRDFMKSITEYFIAERRN